MRSKQADKQTSLSGTAGGLSTVMAALGALKLGALTLLHADTIVDSLETKTR